MRWSMVGWSNCREMGRIGAMKPSSFQSGLVKNSFYFAQELVSLSRACTLRSLASRNFLLPSRGKIETYLPFFVLLVPALFTVLLGGPAVHTQTVHLSPAKANMDTFYDTNAP